ncbi:MAG: penicillin acylase family protein [Bacteroidota bacterium]
MHLHRLILLALTGLLSLPIQAQIQPDNIQIARDSWGVPHIYAQTDAEVAYGLAWATCEDDFPTMQRQLMAIKGRLAEVDGASAAPVDIIVQFLELEKVVAERFEKDLSPDFKAVLAGYCQGVNAYARLHWEEVWRKGVFPVSEQEIVQGYVLGLALLTGTANTFGRVLNNHIQADELASPKGSNAFAIGPGRTTNGETFLAINSHQPLEGMYSWYEAHLISEEGTNILGATFPGGVTIFLGTNPYLGWAHTVNHADFADVYRLRMHPSKKHTYAFDGSWKKLEKKKARTKVKVGPFRIPVSRTFFESEYGLTLKNKGGYFGLVFAATQHIQGPEQWYRMNKATDWQSFRKALAIQGITGTNIVYADREGHIMHLGNSHLPERNPAYDWQKTLPGDTSATKWSQSYFPLDSLPMVMDPTSGYVFNTNHSPFNNTAPADQHQPTPAQQNMGYWEVENNRSLRFQELMGAYEQLNYEDFKRVKYDLKFAKPLYDYRAENLEEIKDLNPLLYPELAEMLNILKAWDHSTDTTSVGASIFVLAMADIFARLGKEDRQHPGNTLTEEEFASALRYAKKHLMKHFGTLEVPLGDLQRHVRGNQSLAVGGGPEILAAMYSTPAKKGIRTSYAGDSYIQLVRFTQDGPIIESVNAFGASARPESPHYTDQMPLFVQQKTKRMELDWEKVKAEASRIYSPK